MKEKTRAAIHRINAFTEKATEKFATVVVKKRLWFTIVFSVLLIAGIVGFFFVHTNYDSTVYLPDDSEVKNGLSVMYKEYGDGGNASLMIKKAEATVSYSETVAFKNELLSFDGIAHVLWLDDLFGNVTRFFTDEYSQEEYAEGLFLAVQLLSDPEAQSLVSLSEYMGEIKSRRQDRESIQTGIDFLLKYVLRDVYEAQLASGVYSFDREKGESVLVSVAYQLLKDEAVEGLAEEADANALTDLLNGFGSSLKMFYNHGEDGWYSPLLQITFSGTDYADSTINAIDTIRKYGDRTGYGVHLSGNAATTYNSIKCVEKQTTYALIAVGAVVLAILYLFSTSFWEPILYLIAIGVAVVINMGSNALLGSVSYLTGSVSGILQLALSMDYSIFILTRFRQEKQKTPDVEQAMICALKASLKPIGASSLTTIASFVAIMFMTYSIGLDMGIVFAKGVLLSLISVFTFLPGLAVYTNKWIDKSEHKSIRLTMKKYTKGLMKARFVIPVVSLALIVVAAVGQSYMKFGYGDTATFGSKGSIIYMDKQEIEEVFGCQNQLAILLKKEYAEKEATEGASIEYAFTQKTASAEYALTAQSKDVIERSGMASMLPDAFLKQFDNGGEFRRIVIYLDLEEEGEKTEKAIAEIRKDLSDLGVPDDGYYMLGGTSSAIEIKTIVNSDYKLITWISIVLIFLILFVTFKNLILPVLLVVVIQGAVWISMSISVLTGDSVVFLGYLIVSAVMLGATIDYGILLTSNYLEKRKTEEKMQAIGSAVAASSRAILTSSLILICAGVVITLTSTMPAISVFGQLIARTAASSLILVLALLPCLLVIFDTVIRKTTFGKKDFFEEKEPSLAKTETQMDDMEETERI